MSKGTDDCVICHPERFGSNPNWSVLCPACFSRLMRECTDLRRMDQWVKAEVARAQAKAEGGEVT